MVADQVTELGFNVSSDVALEPEYIVKGLSSLETPNHATLL